MINRVLIANVIALALLPVIFVLHILGWVAVFGMNTIVSACAYVAGEPADVHYSFQGKLIK